MKKYGVIALVLVLTMSLCACGRKDDTATTVPTETTSRPTTQPTAAPTTETTIPMLDPTVDTNIPDPTVDHNSTEGMDGGMTDNTENTTPSARGRRGLMK